MAHPWHQPCYHGPPRHTQALMPPQMSGCRNLDDRRRALQATPAARFGMPTIDYCGLSIISRFKSSQSDPEKFGRITGNRSIPCQNEFRIKPIEAGRTVSRKNSLLTGTRYCCRNRSHSRRGQGLTLFVRSTYQLCRAPRLLWLPHITPEEIVSVIKKRLPIK